MLSKLFCFHCRKDGELSVGFQPIVYMLWQHVFRLHETKTKGKEVTVWTRWAPCRKASAVSLLKENVKNPGGVKQSQLWRSRE